VNDGDIKFSLFLTNQQRPDADQSAALEGQLNLCRQARDYGWDGVFVGQHHLSEGLTHLQPAPFLGRLAPETGCMTLGVGITLLSLHNPVDIAETYASLDVVCGGRLVFGVGLGYREVEYRAFGIDKSERVRRLEENLEILVALWAGEAVTVDLPWCRLDEQRLTLLPLQRPRPPLWMAANSDAAVARAARLSDAWMINPHATSATIGRQLVLYEKARIASGKAGAAAEQPVMREVFCAESREKAIELAGPYLKLKYEAYSQWGQDKVLPGNVSFSVPFHELAADRFVVGSPDDCIHALMPWREEFGINHFIIRTDWAGMPEDIAAGSIRMLTEHVFPALREK
jgi:alkanesulfonate monooxygenase SsuD/methylene tetrahydromethanopterin reductase-like flavin-dependent oxidoreductase (luciferase family)